MFAVVVLGVECGLGVGVCRQAKSGPAYIRE